MNIAIIFAAGIGQRLNNLSDSLPKQFLELDGKPILIYTLEHFQNHNKIDKIYISTLPEYINYTKELTKKYGVKQAPTLVVIKDNEVQNIVNLSNIKKYIEECNG